MKRRPRLVYRADASERIGTGHVMRGIALAQAWQEAGGEALFVLAASTPAVEARIRREGFRLERTAAPPGSAEDAARTASWEAQWIAVDGYHFPPAYLAALRPAGARILAVDDWPRPASAAADLVLNPSLTVSCHDYPLPPEQLLLGPRYLLLRREFTTQPSARAVPPRAERLLVTLGGADPQNWTSRVIAALALLEGPFVARVVVGGSNPHREALRQAAAACPAVTLVEQVDDMPALMAWADLAIASASTTTWELCHLGVPALLLVTADNQQTVAEAVAARGAAVALGPREAGSPELMARKIDLLRYSPELRFALAEQGRALVDGQGARRVVQALRAAEIRLRPATPADCALVYQINNHPAVRRWSFSAAPIAWEAHQRWFAATLSHPDRLLLIAEDSEDVVGVLRFDLAEGVATVSISVAPPHQGHGYGVAMLRRGREAVVGRAQVLRALIKPENLASIRAFQRAGYLPRRETEIRGQRALVMEAPVPAFQGGSR